MKNILKQIVLRWSLVLLVMVGSVPLVHAQGTARVTAYDTMVGFGTLVKAQGLTPLTTVGFTVRNPQNQSVSYSPTTTALGTITFELSETVTALPGTYFVDVPSFGISTSFLVYSGDSVGGDPAPLNLVAQAGGSPAGTVARYQIDSVPASIPVNQRTSIRVTAVDASGGIVPGYRGTILFASTDPNAQLPARYTFVAADQGRKTFDLAIAFATVGAQKITIQHEGDPLVKAEKTVQVTTAQGGGADGPVRITKPAPGTYSANSLEIAGDAPPNTRIRIFDKGQKITEVNSNSAGRFTHITSLLGDGQHVFQAESNGVQSSPVVVTIDSTPARVEDFQVGETTLAPGATTKITIRSDPDLSSVQASIGDSIVDLQPELNNPGSYTGTLTAPARDGQFTINIFITDRIGNVSPAQEVGKIQVDSSLQQEGNFSFSVPSIVTNAVAEPGDSSIKLTWAPAQAESGIAFYRIYYGTNPASLNLVGQTVGPETNFIVTNLENNKTYFFEVAGVDTQNNEGDNRSAAVSATTVAGGTNFLQDGIVTTPVLCDQVACPDFAGPPPATPNDGPEFMLLVISSLVTAGGIQGIRRISRKR